MEPKTEMLKASLELEVATVEQQVLQEELKSSGFISGNNNDDDASRPSKQGTSKSKVLYDSVNLTPVRMSDPETDRKELVPKLSVLKTLDQGIKSATDKANQSFEF